MSEYFSEKYQKIYNKLKQSKPSNNDSNLLASRAIKNARSSIDSSSWKEQGVMYLANNVLDNLLEDCETVESNINEKLNRAQDVAYNKLLPTLETLKEKDSEYDKLLENSNNVNEDSKNTYEAKKKSLESELTTSRNSADSLVSEIKTYSDDIREVKIRGTVLYTNKSGTAIYEKDADGHLVKVGAEKLASYKLTPKSKVKSVSRNTKTSTSVITSSGRYIVNKVKNASSKLSNKVTTKVAKKTSNNTTNTNNSNMTSLNMLDCNWKVINSSIDVESYYNHVQANKICQDSDPSIYGDYCLAFAYIHSSNLKNGSTSDGASAASNYAHAGEFDTFITDSKEEMLAKVYDELNKGNPVILQVNGNKQGTCRHFVTVVGYKDSVTSAGSMTEKDLLILDSWDGRLERMDTSTSRFLTTGASCGKDYSGYRLQVLKS